MTIEHYEQLAKQFQRDTGLLAPGKDVPTTAANDPQYSLTHRQQTWYKWFTTQRDKAVPGHDTLTTMLRNGLGMDAQSDQEYQATEDTLALIKKIFKDWLASVGLPQQMSEEATRQLLITLIDEP